MKLKLLVAVLLFGALPLNANAFEDTVEEITRSFDITYPNGQRETVVVVWKAIVTTTYQRHGKASTPDHLVDDRSCTWNSTGVVHRQAYFVSAAGIRAPITESNKIFNKVSPGRAGPKNFIQAAGGYHTTCGDQMGKIRASHHAAMNSMKGAVKTVVEADAADAEENLRALLKPVRIQLLAAN